MPHIVIVTWKKISKNNLQKKKHIKKLSGLLLISSTPSAFIVHYCFSFVNREHGIVVCYILTCVGLFLLSLHCNEVGVFLSLLADFMAALLLLLQPLIASLLPPGCPSAGHTASLPYQVAVSPPSPTEGRYSIAHTDIPSASRWLQPTTHLFVSFFFNRLSIKTFKYILLSLLGDKSFAKAQEHVLYACVQLQFLLKDTFVRYSRLQEGLHFLRILSVFCFSNWFYF